MLLRFLGGAHQAPYVAPSRALPRPGDDSTKATQRHEPGLRDRELVTLT